MEWYRSLAGRPQLPCVGDRVLIARVTEEHAALRNRTGRVELIADGRNTFVLLDDGTSVVIDISCLDRI